MYSLPQEIEVWYIIPAIRREFAKLLTEKYGLSYDKAGNILGISKAAISQYNKNKRASKIKLHNRALKEIEKSAKIISKDKERTIKEIMRILAFMRDKNLSFEICKDRFDEDEDCKEVMLTYEKYWK
ncbi:MAG: hypothetical protein IIA87_01755 [Nanoarchaeota archaeon]|nr:hypothetical protein [Nanoarchaeota archaeon]